MNKMEEIKTVDYSIKLPKILANHLQRNGIAKYGIIGNSSLVDDKNIMIIYPFEIDFNTKNYIFQNMVINKRNFAMIKYDGYNYYFFKDKTLGDDLYQIVNGMPFNFQQIGHYYDGDKITISYTTNNFFNFVKSGIVEYCGFGKHANYISDFLSLVDFYEIGAFKKMNAKQFFKLLLDLLLRMSTFAKIGECEKLSEIHKINYNIMYEESPMLFQDKLEYIYKLIIGYYNKRKISDD